MSVVLFDDPWSAGPPTDPGWSVVAGAVLLALLVMAGAPARFRTASSTPTGGTSSPRTPRHLGLWCGEGWGATLRAAAVAAVLAFSLGPLLAVARMSENPWLRIPAAVWIELFRGLPVILLMFFSALALDFSIFRAVVLGLVLYNTAVIAEILRAGITSLPAGQRESALAIGLTPGQTLRLILLPQAVRRMLPSLVSQLVVLLKDTSLGYIVGYVELLRVNRELRDFYRQPLHLLAVHRDGGALPRCQLHAVPGRGLPRATRDYQGRRRGGIAGGRGVTWRPAARPAHCPSVSSALPAG